MMMMHQGESSYSDGHITGGNYPAEHGAAGMDGERMAPDFHLVDRVRDFIRRLYTKMSQNKFVDVRNLYYKEWTSLTQDYYSAAEWPQADEIRELCNNDPVFLLCYNELYFRHISVNGQPQIQHRFESWINYRDLFDEFLSDNATRNLILPSEWLSDMIDEFLYQFQDFRRYKHDLANLSVEERDLLQRNDHIWQTEIVLGYLNSFVQRSNIEGILKTRKRPQEMRVLQGMGYFSMFGLCRIHCLLADYRSAVNVIRPIDIEDKRALFTHVSACHINFFYYLGFAYMMMRRYVDAISVFTSVLLAYRSNKDRDNSYGDAQVPKRYNQIQSLTLLATALNQGPGLDSQVKSIVNEKHSDIAAKLDQGDLSTFEELFCSSCPKFILCSPPNYQEGNNESMYQTMYTVQRNWFLREVRQQGNLPSIQSYLKLYTSIPIEKLARVCEMPVDQFRESLLSLKYSSCQVVHQSGTPPFEGEVSEIGDVQFYIVKNMVYIKQVKSKSQHGRYFLSHALMFRQAVDDLKELKRKIEEGKK